MFMRVLGHLNFMRVLGHLNYCHLGIVPMFCLLITHCVCVSFQRGNTPSQETILVPLEPSVQMIAIFGVVFIRVINDLIFL